MRDHEPPSGGSTASIPGGLRIYAVGDVHGRVDLLRELRDLVADDLTGFSDPVITVFLGDYVDRGPDSRQVLDMLVARDWPTPIMALRGNHELAFMSFLDEPAMWAQWQSYGALPTLASYGVDVRKLMTSGPTGEVLTAIHDELLAALPPDHLVFLKDLRDRTAAGDYFFCHAGIRPGVPLEQQSAMDLVTIREPFLSSGETFGRIIVHGHTPLEIPQVRANRIGIDTGAYATGHLTALVLEEDTRAWLTTGMGTKGRRSEP
ncbi:metallophosphoesterase family protein [uncultured Alsobacter sp.]|uniref:metallophosphoesterase family protein n=1 Tax=uncultured Alsobacter sp. TaxID=1748258 RepID=UPI0025EF1644|nr:metallophosphoesterase family protein [uncultured Alsobacter sp.]